MKLQARLAEAEDTIEARKCYTYYNSRASIKGGAGGGVIPPQNLAE